MFENIPEPRLDPPDYDEPRCPVCGAECSTIYRDRYGDAVGCDECVTAIDAWEYPA